MKEGDDDDEEEGDKPRTPKLSDDFEDDRSPPNSRLAESNEEEGSSENMLQTSDDRKPAARPSSGNGNNNNRASQPGAVAVKGPRTVEEEPSIDSIDNVDNNGKEGDDDGDENDNLQIDSRTKVATTPPTIARMPQSAEISNENVTRQQQQQRPAPAIAAPVSPTTTTITNHQDNQLEGSAVEDRATPMVEAELVVPPVEAFHVSIDEENAPCHLSPLEIGDSNNEGRAQEDIRAGMRNKKYKVFISIILVTLIICAISVPVVLLNSDVNEVTVEGTEKNNIITPTQAPTYPYPCYTSTFDILNSQRFDLEIPDAYIICPNTLIEVGTFDNPAIDSYHFVDGDYPIMVIRENVTIQCGIDGKTTNNCVLDGGFIQVLTVQVVPTLDGGFNVSKPVDNMLIRGFTFTGQPINAGPFTGNSVTLSHPGNNIRFEDCRWTDFSAQTGLIGVYRNYFQVLVDLPLAKQSIHATFFNCTFEDIIYDLPLIHTEGHTVSLEQCLFKNIELSLLLQDFCRSGNFDVEMTLFEEGCAGLLFCGHGSSCSIKDICIDDFEYKSPAVVLVTDDSDFVYENLFMLDNIEVAQHTGCELGVAQVNNSLAVECAEIFSPETTCPLL